MNGDVIKSFLVGLGFQVDNASLSKFNQSIVSASKRVLGLYTSVKVLTAGIFWSISKISEGFEQLGYEYRIIAPAINKTLVLRRELLKAYRAAGVDIVYSIQQSIKFNMALAKLQFAFKAILGSAATKFFPILTKQMDIFRKNIYANMPKIQASLEKFINFIFKAFDITTILGMRVWSILQRIYDFFYRLHQATDGWSTIIMGVIAAWKLLNLAFLATPIGQIIAGLIALLALWDDFSVWREGGKSLFNWTGAVETLDAISNFLKYIWDVLGGITRTVVSLGKAFYNIFAGQNAAAIEEFKKAAMQLLSVFQNLLNAILSVGGTVTALGKWIGSSLGIIDKTTISDRAWENFGQIGKQNPLGSQAAANNVNNSNQNVQQQTNINVMGTADSSATAQAVASQQGRVNFDMVRNMKGAVR